MDAAEKLDQLQAAADKNRYEFLLADLELSKTFVHLANTERQHGDTVAAERALRKAESGINTVERFLPDVERVEQRHEIEQKLLDLRLRVAALREPKPRR